MFRPKYSTSVKCTVVKIDACQTPARVHGKVRKSFWLLHDKQWTCSVETLIKSKSKRLLRLVKNAMPDAIVSHSACYGSVRAFSGRN